MVIFHSYVSLPEGKRPPCLPVKFLCFHHLRAPAAPEPSAGSPPLWSPPSPAPRTSQGSSGPSLPARGPGAAGEAGTCRYIDLISISYVHNM